MHANHLTRGLLIACTACLFLYGFSKLQENIPGAGTYFQSYDLISEVRKDDPMLFVEEDEAEAEEGEEEIIVQIPVLDTLDSPTQRKVIFPKETRRNYKGFAHLTSFYEALSQLKQKKGKVRIAYFGDSMIEGDLVTETLRKSFQEKFGGEGVGFVPITSIAPGFRKTIRQNFSPGWKAYNFLKNPESDFPFGISGEYFLGGPTKKDPKPWVEFKGTKLYPETENFQTINLFYGQPVELEENPCIGPSAHNYVKVSVVHDSEKAKTDSVDLYTSEIINRIQLSNTPVKEATLEFNIQDNLPIYGFSFEDRNGVYVDNFPARSHSGLRLKEIPGEVLQKFNQFFEYDLIILHFGLNVVYPGAKHYKRYLREMKEVVAHFQEFMPNTAIVVVSVTDKSENIDGKMQTEPSVPLLVSTQKTIAMETGIGFCNLYRGMGGRNSMVRWTEGDPPSATKDYAHVNRRGARRLSGVIKHYLMSGFDIYEENGKAPIAGIDSNK